MTSDHSPIFANFQVGVRGQYVSNEGKFKSFFLKEKFTLDSQKPYDFSHAV